MRTSHFLKVHLAIFDDMVEKFIEIFMDNFSVFGSSFDICLANLNLVLQHCEETDLVLTQEKCHLMVQGIVLGYRILEKGIEVDKAKVEITQKLPPPSNVNVVRSFLGHAEFYRRFIKGFFFKIAKPLNNLLMKDVPFNFFNDYLQAFETLKTKLTIAPIMQHPIGACLSSSCVMQVFAIGVVLGQRRGKDFQVIYNASRTLNDTQQNYTTTEKKLLALVFLLTNLDHT